MVRIGAFRVFMKTRLNIEPYSYSYSSLDLAAVNHVTQAVVRVGSKFLNRVLRKGWGGQDFEKIRYIILRPFLLFSIHASGPWFIGS